MGLCWTEKPWWLDWSFGLYKTAALGGECGPLPVWTPCITTVVDKQSPPILWPQVFLFWTWQKHLWRIRNAGKHLFRVYWRDCHGSITLKLNIYHFEPPNFGHPPKQLAKNAEKCAIDTVCKAADDPTKMDNFHEPFGHNKSGGLWVSATVPVWSYIAHWKCDPCIIWSEGGVPTLVDFFNTLASPGASHNLRFDMAQISLLFV